MRYAPTTTKTFFNDFDLDSFLGLSNTGLTKGNWTPAYELVEHEEKFNLQFDLPGFKKEDINLEVKDRVLTVSGERKKETETNGYSERFYGTFSRSFTLPESVNSDELKASYDSGVLSVDIPRVPKEGPKKIAIS